MIYYIQCSVISGENESEPTGSVDGEGEGGVSGSSSGSSPATMATGFLCLNISDAIKKLGGESGKTGT